jgi:ABC-2 type transport system ATP-binding protein
VTSEDEKTAIDAPAQIKAKADAALVVDRLSKTYVIGFFLRRVPALRAASFQVPRGCVFGLVGPNGAGKTTTIKILTGLLRASSGQAFIDGHPVPSVASRRRLGYLPERPQFYDHLRPLEYMVFASQLCGLPRRQGLRRGRQLLDFVGLGDSLNKPLRKFSKGMMQRLGIAQTLVHDPSTVILDEPQSGLDPIGRKEVKDIIADLKKRGCTVFFSSHILPDVEDVCDEIAVLVDGRVRDVGRVESLISARVTETEVEVSGLDDEALKPLVAQAKRVVTLESSTVLVFEGDLHTDRLAREVVEAGGHLLRLVPHRERLEDLFMREARNDREAKP